jgi:hypothetical protein
MGDPPVEVGPSHETAMILFNPTTLISVGGPGAVFFAAAAGSAKELNAMSDVAARSAVATKTFCKAWRRIDPPLGVPLCFVRGQNRRNGVWSKH